MIVGSDDTLSVWLNGKRVYHFADRRGYDPESARVEVSLRKGTNRIFVKCGNRGGPWSFSVGVTSAGDYAFLKAPAPGAYNPDEYRSFALNAAGKADHGRVLFADLKGLACIKCHAVKGEGGNVGPDMTGIGVRYPREELIQSILYPSARIFSGYEPVVLALTDGRVLTGLLKSDGADSVEIQDAEGEGRARSQGRHRGEEVERRLADAQRPRRGIEERGFRRPDRLSRIAQGGADEGRSEVNGLDDVSRRDSRPDCWPEEI